jgi:gamma-glutamyltranspeptidase/glutathione hydrolase
MIVAPQPEAVEAGVEVMRAGGNAVDGALACAFVQGVVDPLMCGIAGFGSCGLYLPSKGFHGYIDFHAPAPKAATPTMWEHLIEGESRDGYGFILKGQVNDVGYQAVCLPASLAAYEAAQREHGRLPWAEVLAPAIAWAEQGWTVRPHVARWWSDHSAPSLAPNPHRLTATPGAKALYCRPDGSPKRVGDAVVNRDLGQVLRLVARDGAEVFYRGEIARAIDSDMRANGGLLRLADLEDYRPVRNEPLWSSYRGYRVGSNQSPGGGPMLLEMLNILENFDLEALGHNTPEYLRVVCEAMKRATVDKDRFLGDPKFMEIPLDRLLSKTEAKRMAEEIRTGQKAHVPRFNSGAPAKDTTQVSCIDTEGNCVTMTHSLGMPSGVVTSGLGFMYNGCMGVFDPRPGRPGSIAPGKARWSSICPSIVFQGEKPHLVVGAPGATQIAMGVLQAMLNVLDFGCSMLEAVSRPRFSATSDLIDVSNRIPRFVTRELEAQGYEVVRSPFSYGFAWVHGLKIDGEEVTGGADPGTDGMALAV